MIRTWVARVALGALMAAPAAASAQEAQRLRPDERQRPAPTHRPAGKDAGPTRDPSLDDPKAAGQKDLVTRCRPAGAPTSGASGGALPDRAKTVEGDESGNCVLPNTGQPLGQKAADKLVDPKP